MKEWMAQANPPKESSTFGKVNDLLKLLSSKKITQYFKVLRNTLNNSNRRFGKNALIMFLFHVQKDRTEIIKSSKICKQKKFFTEFVW